MPKTKATKKQISGQRADNATMSMKVWDDSCGSEESICKNTPTVRIGARLLCDACLKSASLRYPKSFEVYWESKILPLA